jgi:hypothetical protein
VVAPYARYVRGTFTFEKSRSTAASALLAEQVTATAERDEQRGCLRKNSCLLYVRYDFEDNVARNLKIGALVDKWSCLVETSAANSGFQSLLT